MHGMKAIAIIDKHGSITLSGIASPVPWWSFSKTVLSIAALRLVENGALTLDDPLSGEAFSLRQLLRHEAGLPDYGSLASYHEDVAARRTPWPIDRLLQAARRDAFALCAGIGVGLLQHRLSEGRATDCACDGLADWRCHRGPRVQACAIAKRAHRCPAERSCRRSDGWRGGVSSRLGLSWPGGGNGRRCGAPCVAAWRRAIAQAGNMGRDENRSRAAGAPKRAPS